MTGRSAHMDAARVALDGAVCAGRRARSASRGPALRGRRALRCDAARAAGITTGCRTSPRSRQSPTATAPPAHRAARGRRLRQPLAATTTCASRRAARRVGSRRDRRRRLRPDERAAGAGVTPAHRPLRLQESLMSSTPTPAAFDAPTPVQLATFRDQLEEQRRFRLEQLEELRAIDPRQHQRGDRGARGRSPRRAARRARRAVPHRLRHVRRLHRLRGAAADRAARDPAAGRPVPAVPARRPTSDPAADHPCGCRPCRWRPLGSARSSGGSCTTRRPTAGRSAWQCSVPPDLVTVSVGCCLSMLMCLTWTVAEPPFAAVVVALPRWSRPLCRNRSGDGHLVREPCGVQWNTTRTDVRYQPYFVLGDCS